MVFLNIKSLLHFDHISEDSTPAQLQDVCGKPAQAHRRGYRPSEGSRHQAQVFSNIKWYSDPPALWNRTYFLRFRFRV